MVSDEVLVTRAKAGAQEAFEELVKRYRALVCYVVLQLAPNSQEVEDITQDVFISAFSSIDLFDPHKASFKTWLFSIVRRRCVDWLRRSKKTIPLYTSGERDCHNKGNRQPEDALQAVEFMDTMLRAFASLSEEQRLCLALQSLEGFSYKEIAEVMGIPIGTVRSRIAVSRKRLLEYLSDNAEDDVTCGVKK